jgi:hypothetical protein
VGWDRIVAIDFAGHEPVYDIEVEGTHNFVANGLLAHNTSLDAPADATVHAAGLKGLSVVGGWTGRWAGHALARLRRRSPPQPPAPSPTAPSSEGGMVTRPNPGADDHHGHGRFASLLQRTLGWFGRMETGRRDVMIATVVGGGATVLLLLTRPWRWGSGLEMPSRYRGDTVAKEFYQRLADFVRTKQTRSFVDMTSLEGTLLANAVAVAVLHQRADLLQQIPPFVAEWLYQREARVARMADASLEAGLRRNDILWATGQSGPMAQMFRRMADALASWNETLVTTERATRAPVLPFPREVSAILNGLNQPKEVARTIRSLLTYGRPSLRDLIVVEGEEQRLAERRALAQQMKARQFGTWEQRLGPVLYCFTLGDYAYRLALDTFEEGTPQDRLALARASQGRMQVEFEGESSGVAGRAVGHHVYFNLNTLSQLDDPATILKTQAHEAIHGLMAGRPHHPDIGRLLASAFGAFVQFQHDAEALDRFLYVERVDIPRRESVVEEVPDQPLEQPHDRPIQSRQDAIEFVPSPELAKRLGGVVTKDFRDELQFLHHLTSPWETHQQIRRILADRAFTSWGEVSAFLDSLARRVTPRYKAESEWNTYGEGRVLAAYTQHRYGMEGGAFLLERYALADPDVHFGEMEAAARAYQLLTEHHVIREAVEWLTTTVGTQFADAPMTHRVADGAVKRYVKHAIVEAVQHAALDVRDPYDRVEAVARHVADEVRRQLTGPSMPEVLQRELVLRFEAHSPGTSLDQVQREMRWIRIPLDWKTIFPLLFVAFGTVLVMWNEGVSHGDLWQAGISPFGLWGIAGLGWLGWQREANRWGVSQDSPHTASFPTRAADETEIGQEGGWSAQEDEKSALADLSDRFLRSVREAEQMP